LKLKNACGLLGRSSPSWCVLGVFRSGHPGSFVVNWNVDPLPQDWPLWISLATSSILSSGPGKTDQGQVRQHAPSMRWFVRFPLSSEASDTISTLIPVESAGSFGDGRCCHPSGYLQIALGLPPSPSPKSLRQFHQTNRVNGMMHDPASILPLMMAQFSQPLAPNS
jgi:hypothetical protein